MALEKAQKEAVMRDFRIHPQDTGSTELQIAMLTQRINELTEHCKTHHKDYSCERGLLKMVSARRGLLAYLARKGEAKYKDLIQKLGLRK
jgi:small subunit ribosomal protein S15